MSRLRLLGHMNYITYSLATVFMLGSLLLLSLSQECFGILSLSDIEGVCEAISERISGRVYYPDSRGINYMSGLYHYISSSSESSACVLEANSTTDVAIALQSIAANRVPFGIKSGGHASNLGFSSTSGILISLTRLNRIEIARDRTSVRVGTGNIWTDVYKYLDPYGLSVVGGRVPGPGVGGFTLGGGYSWLTGQHGLACDTTISYTLVLPSGYVAMVDASQPDLFYALKGGLNKLGVVTEIVFRTVVQPKQIYGGYKTFKPDVIPALIQAVTDFQRNNVDEKAQALLTFNAGRLSGAILILYYHGPTQPVAFTSFDGIPATISTTKTQSFYDFMISVPSLAAANARGAFHTLSTTTLTENFIRAVHNESVFWGDVLAAHSGVLLSYDVEPFTKYGAYATASVYSHADSPLPLEVYFSWSLPSEDVFWRKIMQQSIDHLIDIAKQEGIYAPMPSTYPNYALSTYTAVQVYGPKHAAQLNAIRNRYDPNNIMDLTGGFRR